MKRFIVVFEIGDKERKVRHLTEEIIEKIKIIPLYGGHFNPNMCFEVGIEFPDNFNILGAKVKLFKFDNDGLMSFAKPREVFFK